MTRTSPTRQTSGCERPLLCHTGAVLLLLGLWLLPPGRDLALRLLAQAEPVDLALLLLFALLQVVLTVMFARRHWRCLCDQRRARTNDQTGPGRL